jgi:hypothetical protein
MPKHILVLGWLGRIVHFLLNLARYFIEQAGRVPFGLIFLGQRIAFTLNGQYVQEFWTGNVLQIVRTLTR